MGLLGQYVLPFAVLLALVLVLDPDFFLHENTKNFRSGLFEALLSNHSNYHASLVPVDFGAPSMRTRSYDAQAGDADLALLEVDQTGDRTMI